MLIIPLAPVYTQVRPESSDKRYYGTVMGFAVDRKFNAEDRKLIAHTGHKINRGWVVIQLLPTEVYGQNDTYAMVRIGDLERKMEGEDDDITVSAAVGVQLGCS